MSDRRSEQNGSDGTQRLSRAEIETLCVLHAVGSGCSMEELTARLGFSRNLASIVGDAVHALTETANLAVDDEGLVELTVAGRGYLRDRLVVAGVVERDDCLG